ncbi:NUDIX hydrolase [Cytobacillus firmus]|uniref:NUDIX hydrolase n=1 Tax=Cytobacillus firmus TaxID=1399 RepID=UPI0018CE6178|nr:NUDIX domain-containing protein [Cytobacillus firmus]
MYVNVRAIIERNYNNYSEIVIQTRTKNNEPIVYELPGGQLNEYESLLSCLKREVMEETGLEITSIVNENSKIISKSEIYKTEVECMESFAVYQTTYGPIDSMGIYFRCNATGQILIEGDGTKEIRWIRLEDLYKLIQDDIEKFSWVDRVGIQFYLNKVGFI